MVQFAEMTEEEVRAYLQGLPQDERQLLDSRLFAEDGADDKARWRADPSVYAREALGITFLTDDQVKILRAVVQPPHKVFLRSGHAIGKTFLLAILVCWFFDCFDQGLCISTAPTDRDVRDVLWKEVRMMRTRAGLPSPFIGPSAPEMRDSPDHVAMGFTARLGGSFQGRHDLRMLIIFDECVDVSPLYWEGALGMFKPGHHFFVCACNPTDPTSQAFIQERSGGWNVFGMSSLDHPNIAAEKRGEPLLVPAAVDMAMVDEWVLAWCRPISDSERTTTDIEWRDVEEFRRSGKTVMKLWRPGPSFQARALGQWPQEAGGVWWDALWDACTRGNEEEKRDVPIDCVPEIGSDVARSSSDGSDDTTFHVRVGNTSMHHEWVNGWKTTMTTGRLIELAREDADWTNRIRDHYKMVTIRAEDIPIKVDDSNAGGGVCDRLEEQGFKVIPVNFGSAAFASLKYLNKRSELWFNTAEKAQYLKKGLWFCRLTKEAQRRIYEEFMAVQWELGSGGRRVVEEKKVTKKKLGRSPDSADGVNLAYLDASLWEAPIVLPEPEREMFRPNHKVKETARRNLFGRY